MQLTSDPGGNGNVEGMDALSFVIVFVSAEAPTCDLRSAHEDKQGVCQQTGVSTEEPTHQARVFRRRAASRRP